MEGGASAIQYRNKRADAALRHQQAKALARVAATRNVLYGRQRRSRAVRGVGADGVHLGEDDGSVADARRIVGPERLIGVSCYDDFERADAAVAAGADYVAFGSFFPSSVKPEARRADLSLLASRRRASRARRRHRWNRRRRTRAISSAAGANAVAVISAVFDART